MRRLTALLLVLTLSGCAHVPRAYRPAVVGAVGVGLLAATGTLDDVDRAARDASGWITGDRTTRQETWILHAAVPPVVCGLSMLSVWDDEACAPAAAGAVLYFFVKEVREWGHEGFSPTDGIMDAALPALTGTMAVRLAGWPAWTTHEEGGEGS